MKTWLLTRVETWSCEMIVSEPEPKYYDWLSLVICILEHHIKTKQWGGWSWGPLHSELNTEGILRDTPGADHHRHCARSHHGHCKIILTWKEPLPYSIIIETLLTLQLGGHYFVDTKGILDWYNKIMIYYCFIWCMLGVKQELLVS